MTADTLPQLSPPHTDDDDVVVEDDSHDDDVAFDALLLDRGAFLRRLRQLEREDDKLRQAANDEANDNNNGESNSSDTLDYDSYLQQQAYYDDYKHVNYRFVDFGTVGNNTKDKLRIEQVRVPGSKGGFIWDAGVILAEHVVHEQGEWKNKQQQQQAPPVQMVELGSGTGIAGLYVATALPDDVNMAITDLPELVPVMQANLDHNPQCQANTSAFSLAWGSTNGYSNHHYDVILGADVVAGIYDPVKLAQTIADLCRDEHTLVYLAVNNRLHEIIQTFEAAMRPLFSSLEQRVPVSRNKNPNVTILVATGKRSNQ